MALNKIQRQASRQFIQQSRNTNIGVDTSSASENLRVMDALSKFSSAATGVVNKKRRAEIETKRALGASRAAQDLLKAEELRNGITDDDVMATKLAYNSIVGKHDTMQVGNDFANWYQSNPDADDDTIAAKKEELYQPLFEKYGDDPSSLQQISIDVQESQFSLLAVEDKIKTTHQRAKNQEALTISIGDLLSDPNADADYIIAEELPARAKALGLTEFEYKKPIMEEMLNRASNGDARLLNALESVDWAKDSVLISKSKNAYEQFVAKENAVNIGERLGNIEIENAELTVPWETTKRKIEQLNSQYPNTVSKERVASMLKARERAVADEKQSTDIMQVSWKNLFDENGIPLALNGRYSPEDKKKFTKSLDAIFTQKTNELVESGMSEAQANDVMMKQRLDWSRVNRIKVPLLDENMKGLVGLNPNDYNEESELPEFFNTSIDTLNKMDESLVDLYFPSREDKVFAANLKNGLKNRESFSAFKRAYNVKTNPFKFDPSQRTEITDAVESQLSDKLEAGFFARNLLGEKSVPDYQIAQLRSRVNEEATLNAYNGMIDAESNAKQSIATTLADYSQTYNGTMINTNKPALASQLDVAPNKVDSYLEGFVLGSNELIEKEVGEFEQEDIVFDFANNGTFTLRYKGGEQIGNARFSIEELKTAGSKFSDAELLKLREKNLKIKERKKLRRDYNESQDAYDFLLNPRG